VSVGVVTLTTMFVLVFTAAWLITLGVLGAITDRGASGTAAPARSTRRSGAPSALPRPHPPCGADPARRVRYVASRRLFESSNARRAVGLDTATPAVTQRLANLSPTRPYGVAQVARRMRSPKLGKIIGGELDGDAATHSDLIVPVAGPSLDSLGTREALLDHANRKPSDPSSFE